MCTLKIGTLGLAMEEVLVTNAHFLITFLIISHLMQAI